MPFSDSALDATPRRFSPAHRTTSLANGGGGLGTCGLPESKLRELGLETGFRSVRRLPLENPFNNLYEVKP